MPLLILIAILVMLPNNVYSSYDAGYYAYKNKKYSKAYDELLEPANNCDPDAQLLLAMLNHHEHIDNHSPENAIFWLTKAAKNNHIRSQSLLGSFYYVGMHVKQDYSKALYWSETTAKNGDIASQRFVGIMYFDGYKGAPADWSKAYAWLSLAAEKGDSIAKKTLSELLEAIHPERLEQGNKLLIKYREKYTVYNSPSPNTYEP